MIIDMNFTDFLFKLPDDIDEQTALIKCSPSFSFANRGCLMANCFIFTYEQEILDLKMNTINLENQSSDVNESHASQVNMQNFLH